MNYKVWLGEPSEDAWAEVDMDAMEERFQATEEFRDALEIWTSDDWREFNPNPNYPWTPMDIFPNTEKYRKMFYDFVMKWWVQQSEEKNELFQN